MSMRHRVHHRSRYVYDKPVNASFNEARLTPLVAPWQQPLETTMQVDQASWQHQYVDYWGTRVRVFEAQRPHTELVVDSTSVVEVDGSRLPQPDTAIGWADLRTVDIRARLGELMQQTPGTTPDADLLELAERLAAEYTPHETALALCTLVHEQMSYLPGSTVVHTEAREAWRERSGVCQDYAHIVIGALRHVGVPARYVSGYLHPNQDAVIGETATGESHAWVEWWLAEWVGHDPTNNTPLGERHILVGRGRDYRDVPPIKGIVAGSRSRRPLGSG